MLAMKILDHLETVVEFVKFIWTRQSCYFLLSLAVINKMSINDCANECKSDVIR